MTDPAPTYQKVREQAKNWEHYFAFYGLYSLTGEGDGVEILLADDDRIYRVDTTDAFPISNFQLDAAGIHQTIRGLNPQQVMKKTCFPAICHMFSILLGAMFIWQGA